MRRALAAVVIGSALVLAAACGSSSSTSGGASVEASSAVAAESPAAASEVTNEVPDPCTLLTADAITVVTGVDPGTGTLNASDPSLRNICAFDSGLILGIEVAADWDETRQNMVDNSEAGTTKEISDVGNGGVLTEVAGGGVVNLAALGGDYFVGVSGNLTPDQAKALASAMLTAIG